MTWTVFLIALAGATAWKMAEFEDRSPWPWALGATALTAFLILRDGIVHLAAPLVSLVLVFAGLWWMRSRDGERGGKVVK